MSWLPPAADQPVATRGAEWFVFRDGRIFEIRSYYQQRPETTELEGFLTPSAATPRSNSCPARSISEAERGLAMSINLHVGDGQATVTINRPERMNALDEPTR